MKSIRRYLLARLLLGLGGPWLLAAFAILVALRHVTVARMDAELKLLASETRFLLPEANALPSGRMELVTTVNFFVLNSGYYFEAWGGDAIFSDRSPSLGRGHLPQPAVFNPAPVCWNGQLSTGEKVRLCAVRLPLSPSLGETQGANIDVDIVVARNREELDRTLSLAIGGLTALGLLGVALCALVATVSIRTGLAPLGRLAGHASRRNGERADARFPTEELPCELRVIAARLNDAMDRLAVAYERERRFSSNLAHELRTPIAELKTLAECAIRWPDRAGPDAFREALQIAAQMQSLTEDLLALARIERGMDAAAIVDADIAEVVASCWQPLAAKSRERCLKVERACPAGLTIHASTGLLRMILANLLTNAVEHAAEGGCVRIAAERLPGRGVRLRISNTVEDIRPEDVPHLFERLWRRDGSRADSRHHGLGLSIAQACSRAMGMSLSASLSEDGTLLTFELVSNA